MPSCKAGQMPLRPITCNTAEGAGKKEIHISLPSSLESPPNAPKRMLKDGINAYNLAAFLACSFITIAAFVFINTAQSFVLVDFLKWPRDALGRAQGNLSSIDVVISALLSIVWGVVSDRIGRRPVFATGFLLMSVACLAYPHARSVYASSPHEHLYASLIGMRMVFACGASAAADMLTVVLGDYAAEGMRARLAGLMGFCTGLGACFGALFLARIPTWSFAGSNTDPIILSFQITSVLLGLAAFIAAMGVRTASSPDNREKSLRCWWFKMIEGCRAASHNWALIAAYLGGFVARADSILLVVFLPPWIMSTLSGSKMTQTQAMRLISTLSGISHMTSLFGAPSMGIIADRLGGPRKALLVPALLGTFAYLAMFACSDPQSKWVYLLVALQGLAQIGMVIVSMALVASEAPAHIRGAVSGVYSMAGSLGIVVVGKLGGILADEWKKTSPFLIVAIANLVLVGLLLLLNYKKGSSA